MKYREVKKRINILHAHGFEKVYIGEETGYIKHIILPSGQFGSMVIDTDDVTNDQLVYFEEYIINCIAYAEKMIHNEFVRWLTDEGSSLDE